MATYEELIAKSRELAAAGQMDAARRVAEIALKSRDGGSVQSQPSATPRPNPDGTYGQAPDGFVTDPNTGAMTSRELMANNMDRSGVGAFQTGADQGAFWGGSDELAGAAGAAAVGSGGTAGERYDFNRERERAALDAARRDHPIAAFGGEMLGSVASGGLVANAGRQALTKAAPKAVDLVSRLLGRNMVTRAAGSAAAGATGAGAYGFSAGEGGFEPRMDQALNAGMWGAGLGAGASLGGDAIAAYLKGRAGRQAIKQGAKGAPTSEQLRAEGRALYDEVERAGVNVKPDRVRDMASGLSRTLRDEGADSIITPGAARVAGVLDDTANSTSNSVPFRELDRLRRISGNAATSDLANKPNTRLATMATTEIDDFVNNLGVGDIDAGDIQALQSALPKARETWARMSRSQLLDDAIERGGGETSGYLSGGSSGIRNQFARILRNEKLSRGFSEVERKAMARVVNGTLPEQMLNLFGGGLGQLATVGLGAAAGGVGGVPGMLAGGAGGAAIGAGVRRASEAMTRKNAELARALVANRGNVPQITSNPNTRRVVEELLRNSLTPAVSQ